MFRDTLISDRDTLIRDTWFRNTYRAFLVVNFLAEVGGYLGLFLGYSFLHISQGFSFFYNAARCGHNKGTVSPEVTNFLKGLNILIHTFCVCAHGFQDLSKAFYYTIQINF
jgi:hypothetical protein